MSELDEYTDARELTDDHKEILCAACGIERWFQLYTYRSERDRWRCETCNEQWRSILEYPCPDCDTRMCLEDGDFQCNNQACENDGVEIDTDELIDRLSGDDHFVQGMPGVMMGNCPVCGDSSSVNGGPDGELECRECPDFYAGRYSDEWYCYAIWMENPDIIRVRDFE